MERLERCRRVRNQVLRAKRQLARLPVDQDVPEALGGIVTDHARLLAIQMNSLGKPTNSATVAHVDHDERGSRSRSIGFVTIDGGGHPGWYVWLITAAARRRRRSWLASLRTGTLRSSAPRRLDLRIQK